MTFLKHFFVFLLLFKESDLKAFPSLFFSKEELTGAQISSRNDLTSIDQSLTLSSLTYVDATHWSLWLNTQIVSPDTPLLQNGLSITRVTPENVTFTWAQKDRPSPTIFTLCPGETYNLEPEE